MKMFVNLNRVLHVTASMTWSKFDILSSLMLENVIEDLKMMSTVEIL